MLRAGALGGFTATGGTAGDRQCSAKFSPMFTNGELGSMIGFLRDLGEGMFNFITVSGSEGNGSGGF